MTDQAAQALSERFRHIQSVHLVARFNLRGFTCTCGVTHETGDIDGHHLQLLVAEALAGQEEGTTDAALVTRITSALYNCADELEQDGISAEAEAAIVERYVSCILRAVRKSGE